MCICSPSEKALLKKILIEIAVNILVPTPNTEFLSMLHFLAKTRANS